MATFKYGSGAVTAAKRVVVKDVFVQDDEVVVEVTQPAGTILEEVIVRFLKGVTMATTASLGFELGTTSSGSQLCLNTDGFLQEGTAIAANTIVYLASGSGMGAAAYVGESDADSAAGVAAKGWSDDDRSVFFTTRCSDDVISSNGDIEINFVFKHLV